MKRWLDYLDEDVLMRLGNCVSTKEDMIPLTRTYHTYDPKAKEKSVEDCLIYMLEWVLDWNSGEWDYTEEEYQEWLEKCKI